MDVRNKFFQNFFKISDELSCEISLYCVLDLNTTFGITFSELNRVSDDLNYYFLKFFDGDSHYVAVEITENFFLPCLILGIWKSNRAFMGIGTQYSPEEILKSLNILGIKFLITDKDDSFLLKNHSEIISIFYIQKKKFYLLKRNIITKGKGKSHMCYGIMTSGSTGVPKVIQVPWSCILLNIEELMEVFSVSKSDCLFQFSPCSFDPFFIELFLMLLYGCSIVTVSKAIKMSPSDLLQILFKDDINKKNCYSINKSICSSLNQSTCFTIDENYTKRRPITMIQMTPSAFLRWNDSDIKEIILSEKTFLKYLILGGEKFPAKILQIKNKNNNTKIFNIYGITEISCWAFINEIINENIIKPVSLGKPLKYINYYINDKSELLIGSSKRICFMDGDIDSDNSDISNFDDRNYSKNIVFRNTNDVVEIKENELYYMNRSNQIIKKFGIKINLDKIQEVFSKANPAFLASICIFDNDTKKLGLFYVTNSSNSEHFKLQSLKNFMESSYIYPHEELRDIDKPDFLIEISKIPINSHGKCNQSKLLEYLKEIQSNVQFKEDLKTNFRAIWKEVLGLKNSHLNSSGFLELGGNSVLALQLINRLEDLGLKIPANFIVKILKGDTEETCLNYLMDTIAIKNFIPSKKPKLDKMSFIKLSVKWKFNFNKCIDATPCCFKYQGCRRLIVGSHSSKLSCINLNDGNEIWTINLTDRIESGLAVTADGIRGIVGCYDTFAYCLSMIDGTIFWKFKTGDIIKSTPCLSRDEKIVFVASYDKYLYCLSVKDGYALKRLIISKKGIYSSGVIGGPELNTFFLGSLDGSCMALNESSLELNWTRKFKSPIFASPCLLNEKEILFVEVIGTIYCLNTSNGITVWTYSVNGCTYSTPISCLIEGTTIIIFGCNDSSIYCLSVADKPKLKWRQEVDSSVFARPCLFNYPEGNGLIMCTATTKGFIYLCDISSGKIRAEIKLDGEVFSSPVSCEKQLYVGSRDNNLYALEVFSIEETFSV